MSVQNPTVAGNAASTFRPSFYFWMILVMAGFVFGGFGIALATTVVFMGTIITMLGATGSLSGRAGPNLNHGIYLGFLAVSGFALMFTLAIRNVRRPEIHRRLMLLAMLPLLPPGIDRLYMVPLGLTQFPIAAMYMTLDAMALAIVIQEWRSARRISGYTLLGVGWVLVQQALHYPVTHAQWFGDFVRAVGGMMHYR